MNIPKIYYISHLTALFLGLLFYTSIGLLFIIANVPLRVIVFLLLLFVAKFKKPHYIIIIISSLVGLVISPYNNWQIVVSNVLSWGCLTGSILGSLLLYESVFSGGDFASISRFFKNKNKVAIDAYYAFKIIPMISDLLERLLKAFTVYGKKKYLANSDISKFKMFIDMLDSFFNELLAIMFSQFRVMDRREKVAYSISSQKREVNLKILILQLLIIFLVVIFYVLSKLNIV